MAFFWPADSALSQIHQSGAAGGQLSRPTTTERLPSAPRGAARRRPTNAACQEGDRTARPRHQRGHEGWDRPCGGASLPARSTGTTGVVRPDAHLAGCAEQATKGGWVAAGGECVQPVPRFRGGVGDGHADKGRLEGAHAAPGDVVGHRLPDEDKRPLEPADASLVLEGAGYAECAVAGVAAEIRGRIASVAAVILLLRVTRVTPMAAAVMALSCVRDARRPTLCGAARRTAPICLQGRQLGVDSAGRAGRNPERFAAEPARRKGTLAPCRDAPRWSGRSRGDAGTSVRGTRCRPPGRVAVVLVHLADQRSPSHGPQTTVSSNRAVPSRRAILDREPIGRGTARKRPAEVGPVPYSLVERSVVGAAPHTAYRLSCVPTGVPGCVAVPACQSTRYPDSPTQRRAASLGGLARHVGRSTCRRRNPASGAAQGRLVGWWTGRAVGPSDRMRRRC